MKTTTFLRKIEKTNNCELTDAYSEISPNGVCKTTFTGMEDKDIIVTEKNGKLLSAKEFDLKTCEETIIYQSKYRYGRR